MTLFVHLNGPPGIGKSTQAALYADRHPGTLNLDIDRLHPLVGGWRDPDTRTHDVLRPVALAMAATHLTGGRNVVLPQYLAEPAEIEAFAQVASSSGAEFREIILLDGKNAAIDRFDARPDDDAWAMHNRWIVAEQGGTVFLAAMYDRLTDLVGLRPSAVVIRSEAGAAEKTYALLVQALDQLGLDRLDGYRRP